LLERYQRHANISKRWKQLSTAFAAGNTSTLPYRVVTDATLSLGWAFGDLTWNISTGNENCSYSTIATKALKDELSGMPYCLRHNVSSDINITTAAITVIPCFPTNVPCFNRDVRQHWLQLPDNTIRPASRRDLCLTTGYNFGDTTVYVKPCNDSVTQHWSWFGKAPGDQDQSQLFFGIGIASLGVVVNS